MGTKEEKLPIRHVTGYHGALRPLQVIGGRCITCQEMVWVDVPFQGEEREYQFTDYQHLSCIPIPAKTSVSDSEWHESAKRTYGN